ncbi:effector binding domain-containing protein [Alkalihalobacterium elongatum]|uniref:effector binding domain-containing protein n=1 Tax=Alkalihalobacterium elongatum TaxID=2675466 RepID=UPI001C1F5AF9|nr:effector binding domain-containing protein [Alkalihalobacterium elongatum]
MTVKIVEHNELKLIGIPCISLKAMPSKYENAKEGLLSVAKHLPQVINEQVHYGIWPQSDVQKNPETHVYILCVEVSSFEGIPEWFFKTTIDPQKCVVAIDNSEKCYDNAGEKIGQFLKENGLKTSSENRKYTICERYDYEGEGYSRYSLPII